MEITQMVAYMSLFKDVQGIWSGLNNEDQSKFDALLKRCVVTFVPEGTLDEQKRQFLDSKERLPKRLMALAADPEVKTYVANRFGGKPKTVNGQLLPDDRRPIVKCRMCGSLQQLDLEI